MHCIKLKIEQTSNYKSDMKKYFIILFAILGCLNLKGQNKFPNLKSSAQVNQPLQFDSTKLYTIIVYGGLGCPYSGLLIKNLDTLDSCSALTNTILIMNEEKDTLQKYMKSSISKYLIYSNKRLKFKLKRKRKWFPQLMVYKNGIQVYHKIAPGGNALDEVREIVLSGN